MIVRRRRDNINLWAKLYKQNYGVYTKVININYLKLY